MVMFYQMKCNACEHDFTNRSDKILDYDLYKCVNCNTFKKVKKAGKKYVALFRKKEIGICNKCQGKLYKDDKKRCPKCL
jgi:hypothetical protein